MVKKLLKKLAERLSEEFGKGFDVLIYGKYVNFIKHSQF